jgi:NADP-dependent 3-hydroxy acid dehydrogenase YdfG
VEQIAGKVMGITAAKSLRRSRFRTRSSGIGLSTAMALSDRGAKVALSARSGDALQKLSQQLPGSLPVTADMTKFDRVREAVRAVYQHYGRIDGLVNNAGRSYAASIEEIEPEIFDEIFHLNVLGRSSRCRR